MLADAQPVLTLTRRDLARAWPGWTRPPCSWSTTQTPWPR